MKIRKNSNNQLKSINQFNLSKMKNLGKFLNLYPIWMTFLTGSLIANLSPDSVLNDYVFLRQFCNFIASLIPSIAGYANNSQFPQVTALYFSTVSIFGIPMCWELRKKPELIINDGKNVIKKWGNFSFPIMLFGCTFMIFLFIFAIFWNTGKPWNLMPIHSSKFALTIFGPIFALSPFLLLSSAIAIFQTWRKHS